MMTYIALAPHNNTSVFHQVSCHIQRRNKYDNEQELYDEISQLLHTVIWVISKSETVHKDYCSECYILSRKLVRVTGNAQ